MPRLPSPSLRWLLVFVPISIGADVARMEVLTFITSALAIVPLAGLIGESTEQLSIRLGPQRGGLLNATMGNLTELIVGVFLVAAGEFTVVKATLIGSIVGNLLLVLGLSFAAGGFRHKTMEFNPQAANVHASSLLLAVAGLVVPALLIVTTPTVGFTGKEVVSAVVAAVLIAVYLAALIFTQVTHAHLFHVPARGEVATWSSTIALGVLTASAVLVGVESDFLVSSLDPAVAALHIPTVFVGLILIPVIGNAAEHASAVFFALKDRLNVTLEIAVGSSSQVAMFVAPVLVFISLVIGHPMDFIFTGFEIAIVGMATLIVIVVSLDGRTNWLEGVQLLGAYLVIAISAYFVSA
ncbi:MAG TPA: calcium/proton exchanger [Candidatus Dormibacteraeota bacterium]|nr:calcium/proton exchanger [Candidatus Dormibacteraeota bacterium]